MGRPFMRHKVFLNESAGNRINFPTVTAVHFPEAPFINEISSCALLDIQLT